MSMEEFRAIYLAHLEIRLGGLISEITRVSCQPPQAAGSWRPAINAYRCRDRFLICAELAGVDRSVVQIRVEPRRLLLKGRRLPPEPRHSDGLSTQVLALEMDHGAFEREIVLPVSVDRERTQAEQGEGLLWIVLPVAEESQASESSSTS